jgi:hypothetical protein
VCSTKAERSLTRPNQLTSIIKDDLFDRPPSPISGLLESFCLGLLLGPHTYIPMQTELGWVRLFSDAGE